MAGIMVAAFVVAWAFMTSGPAPDLIAQAVEPEEQAQPASAA